MAPRRCLLERLRSLLQQRYAQCGSLTDSEVLEVSHRLDRLVLRVMRTRPVKSSETEPSHLGSGSNS